MTSRYLYVIESDYHVMGVLPLDARYSFALENGLEPKNPLCAENGEGCADSRTRFLVRSICAPFFLA